MRSRQPLLTRLLSVLFVGAGAEFVRGDLEESWQRRRMERGAAWLHVRDVVRSLVRWWSPGAVGRRRREAGAEGAMWRGPGDEVRGALRGLRRRPAYIALVVLTLGLGIGATTTIFGVVDAVLIRPLPYEGAEQLVVAGNTFPGREWADRESGLQHLAGVSLRNFVDWRERARTVELVALEHRSMLLPDRGYGPELVSSAGVTPGFFEMMRAGPALGRGFVPDDFAGRNGAVAILSHAAWVNRYGADPAIVGGAQETAGTSYSVIGVLPADFEPPEALYARGTELWTPIDESDTRYENRGRRSLLVMGRLAPGATVSAARAELDAIQADLAVEYPDGNVYPDGSRFGAGANGLQAQTVGTTGRTLWLFLGAAGLLLVIAMLNAANLLLVHALDRREDQLVRAALGASRGRLIRETLAESTILALSAGMVGALLAYSGTAAFIRFGPGDLPRLAEVAVNVRVLAACTTLSLFVGLAVGMLPALRLPHGRIASGLRAGSTSLSHGGVRTRTVLVGVQLAVALVLGVGASLLFNSFLRLRAVDPGFQPAGVITFSMGMKRPGVEDQPLWQGWNALLREVEGVAGLDAVGAASNLPYQSPNWAPGLILPGGDPTQPLTGAAGYVVTPGYLAAAGTEVLSGRGILESDGPGGAEVVLVNEAFVRAFAPDTDLLGVTLGFTEAGEVASSATVVGIVEDVVQTRAEDGWLPAVYVPHTQAEWPVAQVLVRTDRDPADVTGDLRLAARRFTDIVPASDLSTMRSRVSRVQTGPRFHALLFLTFAVMAIVLAGIGLYGTLAHSVGRRRREMGIRMALGAESGRIFAMVLRQGLIVGAVGTVLGLAGALALSGLLRGYLYDVQPLDAPTFAIATALMMLVIAVAALRPAMRATRVDVNRSLRAD